MQSSIEPPPGRLIGSALFLLACSRAALPAENSIALGYGEGAPGSQTISMAVTARHDQPIHGFSLSIAYPRSALQLREINVQGTSTAEVGAEYFQQTLDDSAGTAVAGVIFPVSEPSQTVELPATPPDGMPQLIAWLVFDVTPGAPLGEQKIELRDGTGMPPVSNRFTYRGTTIQPSLVDGSFVVQGVEDVLTLQQAQPSLSFPGFTIAPFFAYARHPKPLQGFQIAVSFDPRAVDLTDVTLTGTSLLQSIGSIDKIEFLKIQWLPDEIALSPTESRTTAGIYLDYLPPYSGLALPPETSSTTKQSILKYSFQPKDGADQFGQYIPLTLSDTAAPDSINNVFVFADAQSLLPKKVHGRIFFSTGNLSGSVVSFGTGAPLGGASVTLEPGGYAISTKADGTFLFSGSPAGTGIPPGPYSVLVTKSGHFPAHATAEVAGEGMTSAMAKVILFPVPVNTGGFRRGMVTDDDRLDISDCIALLEYLFLDGRSPSCLDSADENDDGRIDLGDAIGLLFFIFLEGKAPPPPFVTCGTDSTIDDLDCQRFDACPP